VYPGVQENAVLVVRTIYFSPGKIYFSNRKITMDMEIQFVISIGKSSYNFDSKRKSIKIVCFLAKIELFQ